MAFNINTNGNSPTAINVVINGVTNSVSRFDVVKNDVTTTVWIAFTSQEFNYTGDVQTFTAPVAGTYKLEVYGASGGTAFDDNFTDGGLGGYATGTIELTQGQTLYVVVGEQGTYAGYANLGEYTYTSSYYNGGGKEGGYAGGGGGATHIAKGTNRGELKNYVDYKSEVLIVAGGGGGNSYAAGRGGSGGGTEGGQGLHEEGTPYGGKGGTQSGVGDTGIRGGFGYGGQGENGVNYAGGGGGGWYGGNGATIRAGGGGGSGYIGGVSNGSMSNGVRAKHGFAKITLL